MMNPRAWWLRWHQWSGPRRRLKVTSTGRTYLLITVGVGLAALNTGNNLLYLVLGFLLSVILLSGVLSERMLRELQVKRLMPSGAFAFESFPLRYEVIHPTGRAFAVRVSESEPRLKGSAWISTLAPDEARVATSEVTAPRRGPLSLQDIEVSTLFPFGLFEKTRLIAVPAQLLIFPRRGFNCEPQRNAPGHAIGNAGSSRFRDGGGDLLGLRELMPTEDARRIHWKKSAAVGKALTTEREREERRQYTLRLSVEQPLPALDAACEELAAEMSHLLDQGHEVGLHAGHRKLRPGSGAEHERRLLCALALAGFEEPHP